MFELGVFLFGFIFAGLILEWCGMKMWIEEEEKERRKTNDS
tara:strand:- start:1018 stop:1140 length:123 start_codon:yes stop_codon:yes gene_type:complete